MGSTAAIAPAERSMWSSLESDTRYLARLLMRSQSSWNPGSSHSISSYRKGATLETCSVAGHETAAGERALSSYPRRTIATSAPATMEGAKGIVGIGAWRTRRKTSMLSAPISKPATTPLSKTFQPR